MTPATSSSAPSPNGETDMNDIDIEGPTFPETEPEIGWRQFAKNWMDTAMSYSESLITMSDAIETGRQWETIARRLAGLLESLGGGHGDKASNCFYCQKEAALAAFRDVADRTPGPHHDGGAG